MSTPGEDAPQAIVVGVDGSPSSHLALEWAARQAELVGAPLTVVTTWHYPTDYGYVAWVPEGVDFAADAKAVLDQTITEVLGANPPIEVRRLLAQGHPARSSSMSRGALRSSSSAVVATVSSRGCCSAR